MNRSSSSLIYSSPQSTRQSSKQLFTPRDKKSPDYKKKLSFVKSKISELVCQKGKILKCLKKVKAKLKKSFLREQVLVKTWKEQDEKIRILQEKKGFKLVFDSNEDVSETMKKIVKLSRILNKFRELERKESEVEELENELGLKESDLSLDTRSSENGSDSRETIQKRLLKNKLYKFSFKRESISFHNNLFHKRKEFINSTREELQAEIKSFSMKKEIFFIQENKKKLLRQKVERQEQGLNNSRVKIKNLITKIEELHKNNDELKTELEGLKIKIVVKRKRSELDGLQLRVNSSLEKIVILNESLNKKKKLVEFQTHRTHLFEKKLALKVQNIEAKNELLEILAKIEEIAAALRAKKSSNLCHVEKENSKKNLGDLIQQALRKEREIFDLEKKMEEFL
jgi:hypothetical protein